MKNTWRILAAVTALSFTACPGDNTGDGGDGTTSSSCTGTFTGAVTGTVQSCTVTATKFANNGQLTYTIEVEPKPGSGTVSHIDDIVINLSGDPAKGTYSGSTIQQATSSVYSTDQDKQYDLQLGFGSTESDLGAATLTIDSVPTGQNEGSDTFYDGFDGKAQIKFDSAPGADHTGSVELSLTFKK